MHSVYEAITRRALAEQRLAREERERRAAAEEAERKRLNHEARARHLARLDAEKAERRRQEEERVDQLLAPRRQVEQARWLVANPGKAPADFERLAWPHVRTVLVAELEAERTRQTTAALVASGRYSF